METRSISGDGGGKEEGVDEGVFGCSAVMVADSVESEQSEDACSFDASLVGLSHRELEGEECCVKLSAASE